MYQRGDVVLIPFPFTDLTTIKTRPAVVVSISEFEKETGDLTVAMITSVSHTTPSKIINVKYECKTYITTDIEPKGHVTGVKYLERLLN